MAGMAKEVDKKLAEMQKKAKIRKSHSGIDLEYRDDHHKKMMQVLRHHLFDSIFGIIILANLGLVVIETDIVAREESMPLWVEISGWFILICFLCEITFRIYVMRWDFFSESLNIFDLTLVLVDTLMNILALVLGDAFPVSFLRIIRLVKLARVQKAFQRFNELRALMAGLLGSIKAIFWGAVLLLFTVLSFAIMSVQFVHPVNKELETFYADEGCERCGRAYSSVFQAALTISQTIVAGDSWGTYSVAPIEHNKTTGLFFAFCFCAVGMAVLNLIFGVVVDVASQERHKMEVAVEAQKLLTKNEEYHHLLGICKELDTNGNGEMSKDELLEGYQENAKFRDALTALEVSDEDLEVLWTVLDSDKSGAVSYSEFATNCYKLRSSETNFMLAYIRYYISMMKDTMKEELQTLQQILMKEEAIIENQFGDGETTLGNEGSKFQAEIAALGDQASKFRTAHEQGFRSNQKKSEEASTKKEATAGEAPAPLCCEATSAAMDVGKLLLQMKQTVALLSVELATFSGSSLELNALVTKPFSNGEQKGYQADGAVIDLHVQEIERDRQNGCSLPPSSQKEQHLELVASVRNIKQQMDLHASLAAAESLAPVRGVPLERSANHWQLPRLWESPSNSLPSLPLGNKGESSR